MTPEQVEKSLSRDLGHVQDILNREDIDALQKVLTIQLHLSVTVNHLIIHEKYIQFSKADQAEQK